MEHPNLFASDAPAAEYAAGTPVAVLTAEGLDRFLDYRAPESGVSRGDHVEAPLGPRRVAGVVWGPGQGGFDPAKLRGISRALDIPPMRAEMRAFLERAAEYTLTPLTGMLRLATRAPGLADPPSARPVLRRTGVEPDRMTDARARVLAAFAEYGDPGFAPGELAHLAGVSAGVLKGLEAQGVIAREDAPRDAPFPRLDPEARARDLSAAQKAAAAVLRRDVRARTYSTTLLKGVTGSGKTEVYLEAVAEALRLGRQALVLLPEIALSVEFLDRVEARFGARPVEWHSGVTQANRRRAWRALAEGEAQLVVGARSALFLPYADLGLIVVDEEHDGSYKQEEGALYHARDMAVLRASIEGAAVVLASATPSLETWANAEAGKYARLDLPERFGVAELPEMEAIDLRVDALEAGRWVSQPLAAAVTERLEAGEQSLLFLNRRGYAPLTICRACGQQVGCDDCDARMVEHRFRGRLVCHQCGATKPVPVKCPSCGTEGKMAALGPGVERLAEEAADRWPEARVAILSSDLAESAGALKARIDEIARGGADIVIGTQLVAKGHNFPHLTLVGVIDADLGLAGRRSARGGEDVPADPAGGGARGAGGETGAGADPDASAGASGDQGDPVGRRRGVLARRGRGAQAGRGAALRSDGGDRGERDGRAPDLGDRAHARARRRAAARHRGGGVRSGAGADRADPGSAPGAAAREGREGCAASGRAAGLDGSCVGSGERSDQRGRRSAELFLSAFRVGSRLIGGIPPEMA